MRTIKQPKMKTLLLAITVLTSVGVYAQQNAQVPNDKSVVYFVRASSAGSLINFTYLDSNKVIGKFNGRKYFRYECKPGYHLFWAKSENRDFIEADLIAGKTYFIEAVPVMGAFKAGVQLYPINPNTSNRMKRINKLLLKRSPEEYSPNKLEEWTNYWNELIKASLIRFNKRKAVGKEKKVLNSNFYLNK